MFISLHFVVTTYLQAGGGYGENSMEKVKVRKGDKYGRLTIIREVDGVVIKTGNRTQKRRCFLCVCDCGNQKVAKLCSLRSHSTKSCGCLSKENSVSLGKKKRHGMYGTPTYKSWISMKYRCSSGKKKWYASVSVCDRWERFEQFYEDMGVRLDGTTIDRIDNKKGYSKENCRWADSYTQNNNKKTNKLVEYCGKIYTVGELARIYKLPQPVVNNRIRRGWTVEDAVKTPVKCSLKKENSNESKASKS